MRKGNLVVAAGVFVVSGPLAGCGSETHDASRSFCTVDQEAKTATIMDAILNKPIVLMMEDGKLQGDGVLTGSPVQAPGSTFSLASSATFTDYLGYKTCSVGNSS